MKAPLTILVFLMVGIPSLLLLLGGGDIQREQLTVRDLGDATSGWINDVEAFGGGDGESSPATVSIGDNVYVAFARFDGGTGFFAVTVIESTDGGAAWSQVGDFSPGSRDCAYPAMTAYNGQLYVAFQYNVSDTDHDIYCYVSSAGGVGPWTGFAVRTDTNDDLRPSIASVSNVNYPGVYVVFENRLGGADGTDLVMYRSTGGAFTFLSTVAGSGDGGEFTAPDAAVYDDQISPSIYVAFERLAGSQRDIYFVLSLNGGTTWSSLYQATSNMNDEYAPSISADFTYALISYVMWDGNPDVYVTAWNGASFIVPEAISNTPDIEGPPEAYNWLDDFYVVYSKGSGDSNGNIYMAFAQGSLSPSWGYPFLVSDTGAAADTDYRPGLALCERPDGSSYFAVVWSDFRAGAGTPDIFYSTEGCRCTVNTYPAGYTYSVDGVEYSTEQTFNWPAGFQHTLVASAEGFFYWHDGTNLWTNPSLDLVASTVDIQSLTAYYTAIPEFPTAALPAIVLSVMVLLLWKRRGTS